MRVATGSNGLVGSLDVGHFRLAVRVPAVAMTPPPGSTQWWQ
jgi:hypothetical protein